MMSSRPRDAAETLQLQSQQLELDWGQWGRVGGHWPCCTTAATSSWGACSLSSASLSLRPNSPKAMPACYKMGSWPRSSLSKPHQGPCCAPTPFPRTGGPVTAARPPHPRLLQCKNVHKPSPGFFHHTPTADYNLCMK